MVAGGFRTFVAGETLDEDKINDFLMQGVLVFADATARDAAITDPVHGQIAFLKDTNSTEFYDGTSWTALSAGIEVEFMVVAGGGGGGNTLNANASGGGGAGGFVLDTRIFAADTYTLTVGAGGAGATTGAAGGTGSDSVFFRTAKGGGGGGGTNAATNGGSGGGGSSQTFNVPGQAISNEFGSFGNSGGAAQVGFSQPIVGQNNGGGGGGAFGAGGAAGSQIGSDGGAGGAGFTTSISGSSASYGGGGGGGCRGVGSAGAGGLGGGGAGGTSGGGSAGTANTGGGGGGDGESGNGGNGGSGIVVIAVPEGTSVSFSGGVTQTSTTSGGKDRYVVTATSTTSETVTIG